MNLQHFTTQNDTQRQTKATFSKRPMTSSASHTNLRIDKYQPSKTTVEQVYVQRMAKHENLVKRKSTTGSLNLNGVAKVGSDESFEDNFREQEQQDRRKEMAKRITQSQAQLDMPFKDFYYTHINEIRSIKEFMHMIEKVKRKNIERKMLERIQLKTKLLKIKEIEVWKKMSYYLEKRIRQFLKENEHSENPNARNFEVFQEIANRDPKLRQFDLEKIHFEFTRCKHSLSYQQDPDAIALKNRQSKSADDKKPTGTQQTQQSQQAAPGEKGTSKLLTMKVADKLLSLMLVEESKAKRVPLGGHLNDKKQELETELHKPFGGKMNFTPNSFTWLVENTLVRSQKFLPQRHAEFQIRRLPDQRGVAKEHLFQVSDAPYPPMSVVRSIDQRFSKIDKIMASRTKKAIEFAPVKALKNRRVVAVEYNVIDRIKENVQLQRQRNQTNQKFFIGRNKIEAAYTKNDQYVNLYI